MTILADPQPRAVLSSSSRRGAIALQPTRIASRFVAYSIFAAAIGFTSALVLGFIH